MTGRWARIEKGLETRDPRAVPGMTVMGRGSRSPGGAGDDCSIGIYNIRSTVYSPHTEAASHHLHHTISEDLERFDVRNATNTYYII